MVLVGPESTGKSRKANKMASESQFYLAAKIELKSMIIMFKN